MHLTPLTDVLNCESMTMRPRLSTSTPILSRLRPSVYGRRPMATRTTSASICAARAYPQSQYEVREQHEAH